VQDLRARVVAQDLVRQILNRDGGHIPLTAAPTLELRRAGHSGGHSLSEKRCGGQRWWMGVATERESAVGASRCVVHRVKPVVLCVEGCAPCRERAVVQCQWCSASGAVPVQQCQRYGLCYVARGVAAPPRSRRSCSVGEAPLVTRQRYSEDERGDIVNAAGF